MFWGAPLPTPRCASGCRPHLRGRRGDQQIPLQQQQHLFIAAPGPPLPISPPPSGTAWRLLMPTACHRKKKRGGINSAPALWWGARVSPCPPQGLRVVPWGGREGGVRGGGTGPGTDPGLTSEAVGATMRLCVPGTIGDVKQRQENKGLRDGMTRCLAGTAAAGDGHAAGIGVTGGVAEAGRCCRAIGVHPGGIPASGRCRVPSGAMGMGWSQWYPPLSQFTQCTGAARSRPPPRSGGGCRKGQGPGGPRRVPARSLSHDPEASGAGGG